MQIILGLLITWIGIFGIWKNDLSKIDPLFMNSKSGLSQVVGIFQTFSLTNNAILVNGKYANSLVTEKGGYFLYEIFVENYEKILKNYHINDIVVKKLIKINICIVITSALAMHWSNPGKYKFNVDNLFISIYHYCAKNKCLIIFYKFIALSIIKYLRNFLKGVPGEIK